MSAAVDPAVVEKLGKLLPLLGSDFAGERAAAGLLATRLLKTLGLDWADFARMAFALPRDLPRASEPPSAEFCDVVKALFGRWPALTMTERAFTRAVAFQDQAPSPCQLRRLERIAERVAQRGEEAP